MPGPFHLQRALRSGSRIQASLVRQEPLAAPLPKLTKNRAVKQFLTVLSRAVGQSLFTVCDHWEADLTAVGVAALGDITRLAYVRHTGRGRFFVSLERSPKSASDLPYMDAGTWDDLSTEQAIAVIRFHIVPSIDGKFGVAGPGCPSPAEH